jgi:hypothetical protein
MQVSDSLRFIPGTNIRLTQSGWTVTVDDTSHVFTLTSNGNPILSDSARLIPGTNITSITQSGHGVTINAATQTTSPASPDSGLQYDSANVFAANGRLLYERNNRVLTVLGSSSTGRLNSSGMFLGTALQGGIANGATLRLVGNAQNAGNRGAVRFGANDDAFYDDASSTNTGQVYVQGLGYGSTSYDHSTQWNLITNNQNTIVGMKLKRYDSNPSLFETFTISRARGVAGTSTAVQSGDVLGTIFFSGDVNSASLEKNGVYFQAFAAKTFSATNASSQLNFGTTRDEQLTPSYAGQIDSNQSLQWGSSNQAKISRTGSINTSDSIHATGDVSSAANVLNQFGAVQPYKVYVALLTQSSTSAPVATVLQNTIGTITWVRNSTGNYSATSSALFTTNKTWVMIQHTNDANYPIVGTTSFLSTSNIIFVTNSWEDPDIVGGTETVGVADELLSNTSIEIRVYP